MSAAKAFPHLAWLVSDEHDPTGEIERALVVIDQLRDTINDLTERTQPQAGVMHPVDQAFYNLTVAQRDHAWAEVEALKAQVAGLQRVNARLLVEHPPVAGNPDAIINSPHLSQREKETMLASWLRTRLAESSESVDTPVSTSAEPEPPHAAETGTQVPRLASWAEGMDFARQVLPPDDGDEVR